MLKHLSVFCILWHLIATRQTSVINVEKQTTTVGGTVTLRCQLQTIRLNVFQITWQKETGNFSGPMATCSKVYGARLLGYAANRTRQFTTDTLNVSSITINPVHQEDQGCFKCIFNVYPLGANSGTICLDVYGSKTAEHYTRMDYQTDPNSSISVLQIRDNDPPDQREASSHILLLLPFVIPVIGLIVLVGLKGDLRKNCLVPFIVKKALFSPVPMHPAPPQTETGLD
ncbi:OX-2 membrane glycoprotein-like [Lithobates pipiens]